MPRNSPYTLNITVTAKDFNPDTMAFRKLPGPGEWDTHKVRARIRGTGPYQDRLAYWMFRVTGTEEFYKDCYRVEVHGTQVVIWYWLKNRKGKRYLNPYNRDEAAHAALTIDWAEIPDWMRL